MQVIEKHDKSQKVEGQNIDKQEPPRIIIKIPEFDYKESIVIKSKNLEDFVNFCRIEGAPASYEAFEERLLEEYISRNLESIGVKNLKEMICTIIDKMGAGQ